MKADNILKIVDIQANQISPKILQYMQKEAEPTYKDMKLKEDIFNMDDVFDSYRENEDADDEILSEMEVMMGLIYKKKAGYLRIIYN